jgi:hypothetical protein
MFVSAMVRIRISFHEVKDRMFYSNKAIAELNGTFHLSPNENILTTARIKTFMILFHIIPK